MSEFLEFEYIKPKDDYVIRSNDNFDDSVQRKIIELIGCAGWSMYRGVVVCWDGDYDDRILSVIDEMEDCVIHELAGASESKGSISFVWKFQDVIKKCKMYDGDGIQVGGDWWNIYESIVLHDVIEYERSQERKDHKSYQEMLRSPRWQRKRLEIMSRDNFTCKNCGDTESELHVHHKFYIYGNAPWEYDDCNLITFCKNCHSSTHGRF